MDLEIHVVDAFSLGGPLLHGAAKSYGPITRNAAPIWKLLWNLSSIRPALLNHLIEGLIQEQFLDLLKKEKPDSIVSVHPNFNGSVLNILERNQIRLPFLTLVADLVNIYPLWVDKRADFIISPTEEAMEKCLHLGIPPNKIKLVGFPVRSRFFRKDSQKKLAYKNGQELHFLLISGGEGVGNMKAIALKLLEHFECKVRIIAGRNERLRRNLENSLLQLYQDKVEIFGFTDKIDDLLISSDIAITRASPNVMFEATAANTPLILTGALPGQEEDNPDFAQRNNLGIICRNPGNIHQAVTELIEKNGERLNKIIQSQRAFLDSKSAEEIIDFLLAIPPPHPESVASDYKGTSPQLEL